MISSGSLVPLVAIVAFGVPAWIFAIGIYQAARRSRAGDPSARYFAYKQLIDYVFAQMNQAHVVIENGALFAATVRELRSYPEYKDLTVLLLEALTITGSNKFDDVLRNELQMLDDHLLRAIND